jgi:hypothetical protein
MPQAWTRPLKVNSFTASESLLLYPSQFKALAMTSRRVSRRRLGPTWRKPCRADPCTASSIPRSPAHAARTASEQAKPCENSATALPEWFMIPILHTLGGRQPKSPTSCCGGRRISLSPHQVNTMPVRHRAFRFSVKPVRQCGGPLYDRRM